MRKRIAILSLSILAVCMLLTACNEKNAAKGDAGEASIKDTLKVAKIINKKSNLGLDFLELADEERLYRIKSDSATSQPDIYSIDGTYCGWYSETVASCGCCIDCCSQSLSSVSCTVRKESICAACALAGYTAALYAGGTPRNIQCGST